MSINVPNIAQVFLKNAGVEGGKALTLAVNLVSLIELAENAVEGLKSDQKLAAVQSGFSTVVGDLDLGDKFDAIWRVAKPVISVIVTIYHFLGIFVKKAAV